jgi:hypothetical protein
MNQGNINFRMAVEDMKPAYVYTPSRKAKKWIVRKAVKSIKARDGRFLSKLRKSEINMLGLPHKVMYEVVSDSIALEKTKQAIRYIHYKKNPGKAKRPSGDDKAKNEASFSSANDKNLKNGTKGLSSSGNSDQQQRVVPLPVDPAGPGHPRRSASIGPAAEVNVAPASLLPSRLPVDPDFKNMKEGDQESPTNIAALRAKFRPCAFSSASSSLFSASPVSGELRDFTKLAGQFVSPLSQPLPTTSPPFFSSNGFSVESLLRAGTPTGSSSNAPEVASSSLLQSDQVTDFLRRSLPRLSSTGSQGIPSESIATAVAQGQLQAALQDEHIRALLLADEQRRWWLGFYLSLPPR